MIILHRKGPLYIVPWRCTFACGFNCAHCTSAGKAAAPDELSTEDAKRIVDQAYELGASFFGVTGGEALLRKDLFEVIAYARKIGMNTSIITDGRLLDEKTFKNIVKNETRVSVSVDGKENTNDLVRGKGAYSASVKAIEKLSREKLLNCLVYTLTNAKKQVTNVTEEDFTAVLDLAEKYGARWVIYHGMIPYSKDLASLEQHPRRNSMNGLGTNSTIYALNTKLNPTSTFTIPRMLEWQSSEALPTGITGLITSF